MLRKPAQSYQELLSSLLQEPKKLSQFHLYPPFSNKYKHEMGVLTSLMFVRHQLNLIVVVQFCLQREYLKIAKKYDYMSLSLIKLVNTDSSTSLSLYWQFHFILLHYIQSERLCCSPTNELQFIGPTLLLGPTIQSSMLSSCPSAYNHYTEFCLLSPRAYYTMF